MAPTFSREVEAQHRRIDPTAWADVYVVGDVHGCPRAIDRLLAATDASADDLFVFVGDLVRKGPDSAAVVERVREADNMLSVRGNNEEKLLRGEKALAGLDESDLDWLRSLPVAISWPGGLAVHGGVDPRKPMTDHDVDDLQTTRATEPGGGYDGPFWYESYDGPPRVFFGHTVHENPVVTDHAVGLDTGYVYGGSLTAFRLADERVVRVDAPRTTVERRDAKIVSVPTLG